MPSGSKPLPEPMLTQIASLGRHELSKVVTAVYFDDSTFTEYILIMIVNEYMFFLTYKTFRQTPEYLFCWVKFHTACDGQTALTFTALILSTNKPNRFSGDIANSLASRRCGFNLKLEIVYQWSTKIPPPHRRGWHCSKSQGSHFESDIADNC